MAMNSALNASAIRRASVVLPTPGGPHRIIECGLPARMRRAGACPSPSRCADRPCRRACCGRSRSASGAAGSCFAKRSFTLELTNNASQSVMTSAPFGGVNLNTSGEMRGLRSTLANLITVL